MACSCLASLASGLHLAKATRYLSGASAPDLSAPGDANIMTNLAKGLGLSTLVLGGAMGATLFAQMPATDQTAAPHASQSAPSTTADPNDTTTYATGKPLQGQSKEGFWGKVNPFARKKWVAREVDPIKDRTNELDQLQAKNASNIKDVDRRATTGINNAMMAANGADPPPADAANGANAAQGTATTASSRTDALNGTVSNLDQYKPEHRCGN